MHATRQPADRFPILYVSDDDGQLCTVDCVDCGSRGVTGANRICACAAGLAFRIDGAFMLGIDVDFRHLAEPPAPRPLRRLRDGKRVGDVAA